MKKISLIVLAFSAILISAIGQDNRTLVTIAGEKISVDDFMYVYNKNNTQGAQLDKKSIEEYLDLYINFKLKVKEAESLGLDTLSSFKSELSGYRKQLAEPYFVNDEIMDKLLKEAYERKKVDLRASHILITVGPNAMPGDTLAAFNKAMKARDRVLAGESFKKVAMEMSDDPSAQDRVSPRNNRTVPGNGGDLGYFSVFDMVYPFECGAYNTKLGNVSMPVRSDFGYHIIKVTDRIPAQGSIEAAHLFLQMPENASAADSVEIQNKADELYKRIQNGESYDELVKEYSDDKGSATKGGLLPKFNVNRMVPEFIQVISAMKDSGDISKPVLTSYGWHIIKLYGKTGLAPFDEVKDEMLKKLEKDQRAQKSKEIIINDIKKEYGYKEFGNTLEKLYPLIDSSIYEGKWVVPENKDLSAVICSLGDAKYTLKQLADFIAGKQNIGKTENINEFVNKKVGEFSDEECRAYEDGKLESKYPEFKAIVQEYRDGILLFDLTNDKIWSYASKDTVGLHAYYDAHNKDFMWDTRLDAAIYTLNDSSYIDQLSKMLNDGKSEEKVLEALQNDSIKVVKVEHKKFMAEENTLIDSIKWKKGVYGPQSYKGNPSFVVVYNKLSPAPKSFDEARGLITAGYQEQLEAEWIKGLRAKHPIEVDQEVLSSLIK